jgi:hypothetical protein
MKIQSSATSFSNPVEQVQKHQEAKHCPTRVADSNSVNQCAIDNNFIRPIPGKPNVSIADFFNHDAKALVAKTLKEVRNSNPFFANDAMERFSSEVRNMTPGEIDDVKDAIVAQLSSPNSSQRDRDVLGKMYKLADAASENRMPSLPKPRPLPRPFPIDPGFDFPKQMPRIWDESPIQIQEFAIGQKFK